MDLIEYKEDMETCTRCSACKFIPLEVVKGYEYVEICPSIKRFNFHAFSAGGRLAIGVALLESRIGYSDKLLEVLYNCQMCGGCDVSCKYAMDMEVLDPLYSLRIDAVKKGKRVEVFEKMVTELKDKKRMVGKEGEREWFENLEIKIYTDQKVETLFHVGCRTTAYPDLWEIPRKTIELFRKSGIEVGIGGSREMCCGGRAFELGYKEEFLNHARSYANLLRERGIKTIITSCAECYYAFKVLYRRFGISEDFKVFHTVEYLLSLLKEGRLKLKRPLRMTLTYHDPCHLGRLGEPYIPFEGKRLPGHIILFDPPKRFRRGEHGVYEPPRELLKGIEGIKFFEMNRTKEYAFCCGAGGGVKEFNPSFALWTAKERLEEAENTGAQAIVTACPGCKKNLEEAKGDGNLKILDIAELFAIVT